MEGLFSSPTDGARLFYEVQGQGPAIVLCDGVFCDGHAWKYFEQDLRSRFTLVHWHYPGHGRSALPQSDAAVGPERLADDAVAILSHVGFSSAVFAGHSLGVQVALETWRRHGTAVRGLVLACGSPGHLVETFHDSAALGYILPFFDAASWLMPRAVTSLWSKLPAKPLLHLAMASREVNSRLVRASDMFEYFTRLSHVDFGLGVRMIRSAGQHDASPYLQEIDVPVLVVGGQEDRFTPPVRSVLLAERIPGAELLLVPGATHSLPIEMPELFNLRVRRFLIERVSAISTSVPAPQGQ